MSHTLHSLAGTTPAARSARISARVFGVVRAKL
jgi:hypothetical protein